MKYKKQLIIIKRRYQYSGYKRIKNDYKIIFNAYDKTSLFRLLDGYLDRNYKLIFLDKLPE